MFRGHRGFWKKDKSSVNSRGIGWVGSWINRWLIVHLAGWTNRQTNWRTMWGSRAQIEKISVGSVKRTNWTCSQVLVLNPLVHNRIRIDLSNLCEFYQFARKGNREGILIKHHKIKKFECEKEGAGQVTAKSKEMMSETKIIADRRTTKTCDMLTQTVLATEG